MPSPGPSLSHPALRATTQLLRRVSSCQPSSNRACCCCTILYYPVLSCPVLCTHTHTQTQIRFRGCVVFFSGCVDTHIHTTSSPTVATVSVAQMSGLLQLHLNRAALRCAALHGTGCTALAPQAGIGLDGWRRWAWLPRERASKAVELLRCAPGLPVPLSPLGSVHFQISTHWVPPSIPTRLSTPPPQTRLRHLSLPLSSLNLERISRQLDNSASHLTRKPAFLLPTHQWHGPCSSFLTVWTSLIDRFLLSTPRAIP